jgi:hypothetical protein
MDFPKLTPGEWVALYGAVLSTIIALVAGIKWLLSKYKTRKEIKKFKTDLYFLKKIDRRTKKVHPIVVVLLANLGKHRISLKSLEYSGLSENGLNTTGSMGWYEQPDEVYGIRKRLLPIVLESGQTADLPMIHIGVITRTKNLKIWFTDFDDKRHYLEERDIEKVRRDIEKYTQEASNQQNRKRVVEKTTK